MPICPYLWCLSTVLHRPGLLMFTICKVYGANIQLMQKKYNTSAFHWMHCNINCLVPYLEDEVTNIDTNVNAFSSHSIVSCDLNCRHKGMVIDAKCIFIFSHCDKYRFSNGSAMFKYHIYSNWLEAPHGFGRKYILYFLPTWHLLTAAFSHNIVYENFGLIEMS